MYVKVAIPRPLDAFFDYEYDEAAHGAVMPGEWVRVPFGRTILNACVLETSTEAPALPEGVKIKGVSGRLLPEFSLPAEILKFCRFASEYYQYPIGEALFVAAPPKIEKVLTSRGESAPPPGEPSRKDRALSPEQATVVQSMLARSKEKPDSAFLLEGVTGSGKTEIYIELAKDALARGKGVLILVPEISLTAQLRDRFQSSLQEKVVLWHSALSDGVRQTQWRKVKTGELKVVIGARSALFAPFENLGLIVVDEEHDATYKQEERFRYQARDLALFRAKQLVIPVVLGSATPSLESLNRVKEGRLEHLKLESRYSKATLPAIHRVSLLDEPPVGAGTVKTPLAETTIRAMQAA
ncbi:MAG: primosomal protein N', partial [Proteobacteria bacterium]|nr:primosomal protein N' [Pseudomonadota bacterium]